MIKTKLYKNKTEDMEKYNDCAVWCNANNATIVDKGDYYEVVEAPSIELDDEPLATIPLEQRISDLEDALQTVMFGE